MRDPVVQDPTVVRLSIGFFAVAFVIMTWLAYDTRGALTRLFFWKRDLRRLSPRMILFLRIEAAFVAVGSLYILLSYVVGFPIY
jgi:hypothetical protein